MRMNVLLIWKKSIIILLLSAIFLLGIGALCQDEETGTRGMSGFTSDSHPMGITCYIWSFDRNDAKGGAGTRFLAANPNSGDIGLIFGGPSVGMVNRWNIAKVGDQNLYEIRLANNDLWLVGWPNDGSIKLQPWSSTWHINKIHQNPTIYRMIPDGLGPEGGSRWLFGSSDSGIIGLTKNRDGMFTQGTIFNSDTSWRIEDDSGNDLY
jgi:hypothetical protein